MKIVSDKFYLTADSVAEEAVRRNVLDHIRSVPSLDNIHVSAFLKELEVCGFHQDPKSLSTVTYSVGGRDFTSPLNAVPPTSHTVTGYEFSGKTYWNKRPFHTLPGTLGFKVSLRDTDSPKQGIEGIIEMETLISSDDELRERKTYEHGAVGSAVNAIYRLQDAVADFIMMHYIGKPAQLSTAQQQSLSASRA